MNSSEQAFLVLCEELNFTKAAERMFMSQQGLSSHIRKLEERYETKLFVRFPKVELTESGRAVRDALLRRDSQEKDLVRRIREIDHGNMGSVSFGINGARAAFLAPRFMDAYCRRYREVEVHFVTGDTSALARELRQGKIDGFLGVNAVPEPGARVEPLFSEPVLLLLPRSLAEKTGISRDGRAAEPERLPELSFVRNAEGSTLNQAVDRWLAERGLTLKTQVYISDYSVQLSLIRNRDMAMFCPESIALAEKGPASDPALLALELPDFPEQMEISLVTGSDRNYPACAEIFFQTVRELLKEGL